VAARSRQEARGSRWALVGSAGDDARSPAATVYRNTVHHGRPHVRGQAALGCAAHILCYRKLSDVTRFSAVRILYPPDRLRCAHPFRPSLFVGSTSNRTSQPQTPSCRALQREERDTNGPSAQRVPLVVCGGPVAARDDASWHGRPCPHTPSVTSTRCHRAALGTSVSLRWASTASLQRIEIDVIGHVLLKGRSRHRRVR